MSDQINTTIDIKDGEQFHYEYITQNRIIKQFQDQKRITFAIDNTVSKEQINELKYRFRNLEVSFNVLSQKDFNELLRKTAKYNGEEYKKGEGKNELEDLTKLASDAPVVNLVNELILSAVNKKASDIHFEVFEQYFRVRFRINGYLQTFGTYPITLFDAVCARVKVISKLDITQRRLAQDGKVMLNFYEKKIDIRTSTLPTVFGESIVLRLLGVEDNMLNLKRLGFIEKDIEILKKIINHSYGAFILTGPTGSGKTTTLSALLNMLDSKSKNIITIEDPVEYTIEGINQVQINEKIGYGFGTILRNILRQDPDIIMVGEMRDAETADLALRSAMTGHLVLTTLHTNDAISSITRLVNMGVERYIIESSIIALAAQRLVRTLCEECKEAYKPDKTDKELFLRYGIEIKKLFKPKGCPKCNNTGFKGRKGIFEVFELDEAIRELIVNQESIAKIRKHLKDKGFVSIFEKGLAASAEGIFFLDEVKSTINEIK
jgi:type IV pilus assembly protein PilB